MAGESRARARRTGCLHLASPAHRCLLPSSCSCAAAGGWEAQKRRRWRKEERVAGRGREQALGGSVLPALHALLAHAVPRHRRPIQALRGTSLDPSDLKHHFWFLSPRRCFIRGLLLFLEARLDLRCGQDIVNRDKAFLSG
jgi:hypothetical protein